MSTSDYVYRCAASELPAYRAICKSAVVRT